MGDRSALDLSAFVGLLEQGSRALRVLASQHRARGGRTDAELREEEAVALRALARWIDRGCEGPAPEPPPPRTSGLGRARDPKSPWR